MKLLGIVLVIVLGMVAAMWLGGAGMLGYTGFGMGPGMMSEIGAMIAPVYLALIIGAGVVMVLLVLARTPRQTATVTGNSALEIAKTRYAKGEITKEQFDSIKRNLRE